MDKYSKLTRRAFNTKLTKGGLGLAAVGIFTSCGQTEEPVTLEGKFIDIHHPLGNDTLNGQPTLESILDWMNDNSVSQTVLLSPILYPKESFIWRN
ncbi:MAG: hypothetical protein ACJA2S_000306 [Cyclobacteriaceae bacterium]|jgi:hypothetical protein